jgi:hypothetical protein
MKESGKPSKKGTWKIDYKRRWKQNDKHLNVI